MLDKLVLPQDKANHCVWGLMIYAVIGLWNPIIALMVVVVIATGKEVLDMLGYGTADKWDWVATVAGPVIVEILRSVVWH